MARIIPSPPRQADVVSDALDLIEAHLKDISLPRVRSSESLDDLLDQAAHLSVSRSLNPIRVIRQFACTGGTIINRGIQAQPNTLVLSEVDPYNITPRSRKKAHFVPTDLIGLADSRVKPLDVQTRSEMFIASLGALYGAMSDQGQNIVLREHSHGWFCTDSEETHGPTLVDLIEPRIDTVSLVTTRHPLDSWLSLNANGWDHFQPFTLDEYARRYHTFLDDCGTAPIFTYEDFVEAPDDVMRAMCEALDLGFNESWRSIIPIIQMTGDSGRSSAKIGHRERREVPEESLCAAHESEQFTTLCTRLGYKL